MNEKDTLIQNGKNFTTNAIIKNKNFSKKNQKFKIYQQQSMNVEFLKKINLLTKSCKSLNFSPEKNSVNTTKHSDKKTTSINTMRNKQVQKIIISKNKNFFNSKFILPTTPKKRNKWIKNMSECVSEWMRQSLEQQQQKKQNSYCNQASISFSSRLV